MSELTFKLSDFEGPLELILHLISKHKLSVEDIKISELLRQYLQFIDTRIDIDLEVDSQFIEMASRLVHIKTVMLLPKHEEQAKELKTQLERQLMEYQVCKIAAEHLRELAKNNVVYIRKPASYDQDKTFNGKLPLSLLLKQIGISESIFKRRQIPTPAQFAEYVSKRIVSVSSMIVHLLKTLYKNGRINFEQAFEDSTSRSHIVATFMGILELVKSGKISLNENYDIILMKKEIKK